MEVEACIVTYRSEATVAAAVASVALLGASASVAVHDNSPEGVSLDVARAAAREAGLAIRAESCAENCGFARACNRLAATSSAPYLLFLNPDAAIEEWPQGVLPRADITGPVVLSAAGRRLDTYGTSRTLGDEIRLRWLRRASHAPDGRGYVSGVAMLVSRDAFLALGGFDERMFMYYEDIDLCLRASDAGYAVALDERWRVRHVGGASAAADPALALVRSFDSGRAFFVKRRRSVLLYDLICLVDAALRLAAATLLPLPGAARRRAAQAALLAHVARTVRRGRL